MQDGPVARYRGALERGDLAGARAELHDDLRFRGPFDEFETADDYVDAVAGLWRVVESVRVRHVSWSGDEVVVLYDMVTSTPAGTQLICEWYGIRDDRIAWIRAIFDSAPFASLRSARET